MLEADIVFAMGRTALEAMAAARAVLVIDETSFGGWVSTSSYAALEADGFTGLGLGDLGAGPEVPDDLEKLVRRYEPDLGTQARRLVTRHHAAQHHAAALVELYTAVADTPASATSASTVALLAQDRFALEHRAVTAEWEVARLRRELRGLDARLRRTRARARRFRRQRDRAQESLARLERRFWTRLLRALHRRP
jgi:hypothetical protein